MKIRFFSAFINSLRIKGLALAQNTHGSRKHSPVFQVLNVCKVGGKEIVDTPPTKTVIHMANTSPDRIKTLYYQLYASLSIWLLCKIFSGRSEKRVLVSTDHPIRHHFFIIEAFKVKIDCRSHLDLCNRL